MLQRRPRWWPKFSSTVRSTALTARLGKGLAIAIGILLHHWVVEPLPVRALGVAARAREPDLGLPRHSGGTRRHRYSDDPAAVRQALVGVPESLPLAGTPVCQACCGTRDERGHSGVSHSGASCSPDSSTSWVGIPSTGTSLPSIISWPTCLSGPSAAHRREASGHRLWPAARLADADVLTEIPWNENPASHSNAGICPPRPHPAFPAAAP